MSRASVSAPAAGWAMSSAGLCLLASCFLAPLPELETAALDCTPGHTVDCYQGPEGTDGVGRCHSGRGECASDGASVVSCLEQQTPTVERCDSDPIEDENCDGVSNDRCAAWSVSLSSDGEDETRDAALLPDDTAVVVGTYGDLTEFAGVSFPRPGRKHGFVMAVDLATDASPRVLSAAAVEADDDGLVILTSVAPRAEGFFVGGWFQHGVTFPSSERLAPDTPNNGHHLALAAMHLDRDGGVVSTDWVAVYETAQDTRVRLNALAPSDGGVMVAGHYHGTVAFDGSSEHTHQSTDVSNDIFIAHVSANDGSPLWSQRLGGPGEDTLNDVAVHDDGRIAFGGSFTTSLGSGACAADTEPATEAGYVAVLESDGNCLWLARLEAESAEAVALVWGDALYVVFEYQSPNEPAQLGDTSLPPQDGTALVLAALSPEDGGAEILHIIADGDHQLDGFDLRVDRDDAGAERIFLAGSIVGSPDLGFGAQTVASTPPGSSDAFVASFTAAGEVLWARHFGGAADDDALIAVPYPGHVLIGGQAHSIDLGAGLHAGTSGAVSAFVGALQNP